MTRVSPAMESVILLPPSEGKAPGGTGPPYPVARQTADRFLALAEARTEVFQALLRVSEADHALEDLFGVKGKALDAAVAANRALATSPTRPAIERYTGVLYDHLGYATLPAPAQRRFDEAAIVFSGLLGLVAPRDAVPDYKLKMDATLPGFGSLQAFWRGKLTPVLNAEVENKVVWDLLPNAHAAAWGGGAAPRLRVTARFVEVRDGGERTVSHWNKALKGALVRHLLLKDKDPLDPELAQDFKHEGYRFDRRRSKVADGVHALVFSKRA